MPSPMLTIDVAHPPRDPDVSVEQVVHALEEVRNSAVLRVLKVIHGYGKSGRGGSTRELIRNWAFVNSRHFRAAVYGEMYVLSNPVVQELRREVGQYADADLGAGNAGITVVWVK
jgi:hypothetical protein